MTEDLAFLERKIDSFTKNQTVLAVYLVGGAAATENLDTLRDIDIFIILAYGQNLEREVVEQEGKIWDITYLPLELLKQGIKEKWPFLILSLGQNRPIKVVEKRVSPLLAEIYQLFQEGPGSLAEEEIKYLRFKLTQEYDNLLNRKDDYLNAEFLAHNLFREVLVSYFKLNNEWVPPDKKMLSQVRRKNQELYNLCVDFLAEGKRAKSLCILKSMLEYVLNPFGGQLKFWSKGEFPLE